MPYKLIKGALILVFVSFYLLCDAASHHRITDLKCESLDGPTAIATTRPYLSWKTVSHRNGATVTAYQILAASTTEKLNERDADLWNSGKVTDFSPCGIEYCGHPLSSRSQVYWKVRVWDENGKQTIKHLQLMFVFLQVAQLPYPFLTDRNLNLVPEVIHYHADINKRKRELAKSRSLGSG